jgi:hypothetical protein
MRVSPNVSASVFWPHVDRRLLKAVSAWVVDLQEVECLMTAATVTFGGYCMASCGGDAVAMVAQVGRNKEQRLPKRKVNY